MFSSQVFSNFLIENNAAGFKIHSNVGFSSKLWIDKETNSIQQIDLLNGQMIGESILIKASAILGIYQGKQQNYLLIVENCTLVTQVLQIKYYRIQSVSFIPFKQGIDRKKNTDYTQIKSIEEYLCESFYFSLEQEGSQTLQKQLNKIENNEQYLWNSTLIQLFHQNKYWCATLLQGYIHQAQSIIDKETIKFVLISRRAKNQSGTRFYHRGIDDNGNVANFVESEYIAFYKNLCISHVIYRGSVPCFWMQQNITRSAKLTRSLELSNPAFVKHFYQFQNQFQDIHCINLMGEAKGEKRLNLAFEELIRMNGFPWLTYQKIDFHKEVKNKKFNKIDVHIYNYDQQIQKFSNFVLDLNGNKIISNQKGAYRVNCLDCLDRTNVFQSRLALRILEQALKAYGMQTLNDFLNVLDEVKGNEFLNLYKVVWADNGDAISQIYCGTDATTSELTKQGKQTFKGMILHKFASIERVFNQSFADRTKNQIIESLLNSCKGQQAPLDLFLSTSINRYCTIKKAKVFVCTWNVGNRLPESIDFTKDLLQFNKDDTPDILIIGLQEIVKLNAKSMVISNSERIEKWQVIFDQNLKTIGDYIRIESENLMGLFLQIFVRKQLLPFITSIIKDTIKTGFQGHVGNKGATAIQFVFHDSKITVCNCHLTAGQQNTSRRIDDLKDIHEKAFTSNSNNKSKSSQILDSDYIFFIGDMNFRLNFSYEETLKAIKNHDLALAKQNHREAEQILLRLAFLDEGNKVKEQFPLNEYQECGITFLPTYKYDIGQNRYDTSKKQRVPSYCDRIFLKVKEPLLVRQQLYNRIERFESDHRPVVAYYLIESKIVDAKKKQEVINEFITITQKIENNDDLQENEQLKQSLEQEPQSQQQQQKQQQQQQQQQQQKLIQPQISMTESIMICQPQPKQRSLLDFFSKKID